MAQTPEVCTSGYLETGLHGDAQLLRSKDGLSVLHVTLSKLNGAAESACNARISLDRESLPAPGSLGETFVSPTITMNHLVELLQLSQAARVFVENRHSEGEAPTGYVKRIVPYPLSKSETTSIPASTPSASESLGKV